MMFENLGAFSAVYWALDVVLLLLILFEKKLIAFENKCIEAIKTKIKALEKVIAVQDKVIVVLFKGKALVRCRCFFHL